MLQANLCLSGLAGCYGKTAYPAIVEEAASRIRQLRPDAVTLNEACRRDVQRIARRTGYHLRFSSAVYLGEPLHCIQPDRRGLFGDAVLTKAAIDSADSRDFVAQSGPERRRWLCVATRIRIDVCTAHLDTSMVLEAPANDAQCSELAALLARRAAGSTVIFGGDLNRRSTCAPAGMWTRTDTSAHQAPGLQHVSGGDGLRSPSADVVPAAHTDHDFLLVHSRRGEAGPRTVRSPHAGPGHLNRRASPGCARRVSLVGADPDVIAALEAVVDRDPANLALMLHLAELLLDEGRADDALRRCDAVLAVAPADPTARRLRQRALSRRGLRLVSDEP